ncbi:hypothetical protein KDA00_01930 [Candidatus Saccharibacteria bacterium]|nr:hypothetical protein [Candidatus Saccharibacteria bacterium]
MVDPVEVGEYTPDCYDDDMSMEVFPVVHVVDEEQAAQQTQVAIDSGADGVFLIEKNRKEPPERLTAIFRRVADKFPNTFVGVNYLSIDHPVDVFEYVLDQYQKGEIPRLPDGIWVGNTTRELARKSEFTSVELFRHQHPELNRIRYLGGIAFKYNPLYTDDPESAAEQVEAFSYDMDVVVTSGPGTGKAPSKEKITAMKRAAGEMPLAIASGVNETNIDDYDNVADMILVSTAVETEPYSGIFDTEKLTHLIEKAHNVAPGLPNQE